MGKKRAAQPAAAPVTEGTLAAAVGIAPASQQAPAAVEAPAPPAPEPSSTPTPVRHVAPDGYVSLPILVRAFWTPRRCKRPCHGVLLAQDRLEVENLDVYRIRLVDETDVMMADGSMAAARKGAEVFVPAYYILQQLAVLLKRSHELYYQVWLGNQRPVEEFHGGQILWHVEVKAHPQGIAVK